MRLFLGLMLAVLLTAPVAAQETAGVPHNFEPGPDMRPQFLKDWETTMERKLVVNPEPWEMVWPQAWTALVDKGRPPLSTPEVHGVIIRVAWRAYGTLNQEVLRLEQEERDAQRACAETTARNPAADFSCEVPCKGSCPARLTPAEQASQTRRARIQMARDKMAKLEELARSSDAWLKWKTDNTRP
jgi:hypothetical protein